MTVAAVGEDFNDTNGNANSEFGQNSASFI
jgi:hypothetical protein